MPTDRLWYAQRRGGTSMKRAIAVLAVVLVLGAAILPGAAWAGGNWHGGHRGGHGAWWWPGAIVGGLALGAVAVVTAPIWALSAAATAVAEAPPVTYAPPPAYAPPPPYYAAPPVYSYAPARTPSVQREVVYPNGRHVLYGDGVSQPWQWVWVPAASPPPAPR
jgi:hypothetical protein